MASYIRDTGAEKTVAQLVAFLGETKEQAGDEVNPRAVAKLDIAADFLAKMEGLFEVSENKCEEILADILEQSPKLKGKKLYAIFAKNFSTFVIRNRLEARLKFKGFTFKDFVYAEIFGGKKTKIQTVELRRIYLEKLVEAEVEKGGAEFESADLQRVVEHTNRVFHAVDVSSGAKRFFNALKKTKGQKAEVDAGDSELAHFILSLSTKHN